MSNDLRNKLDQEPLEFDTSAAWEQLSPKLESDKRKRRGLIWWWVGGSASVLVLAFALLYLNADHSSNSINLTPESLSSETSLGSASNLQKELLSKVSDATDANEAVLPKVISNTSAERLGQESANEVEEVVSNTLSISSRESADASDRTRVHQISDVQPEDLAQFAVDDANGSRQILSDVVQMADQHDQGSIVSISASPLTGESVNTQDSNHKDVASDELSVRGEEGLTRAHAETSLSEIPLLGLLLVEFQTDEQLGPLPEIGKMPPVSRTRLTAKPYWQVGLMAGIGYELLRADVENANVIGRKTLETRNLQLSLTRSFNKRLAVSLHSQVSQRHELYQTNFSSSFPELVYNPRALLVGGEQFGDSVLVVSSEQVLSARYATLTRINVGAVAEYLIPTRFCDYAVYGGANVAFSQQWKGSRSVQRDELSPIDDDVRGPYSGGALGDRISYVFGARASKALGSHFQLLFDSRAVIRSRYSIESGYGELFSEKGNTFTANLGLGWRFNQ